MNGDQPGQPLVIIHRDEYLCAIDKPSGMLVHRTELDRGATRFAVQLLRDQLGCRVYPVHRLDECEHRHDIRGPDRADGTLGDASRPAGTFGRHRGHDIPDALNAGLQRLPGLFDNGAV